MSRRLVWVVLVLPVVLAAAKPVATPEELVREGQTAYDAGDYAGAVELLGRAEERATDPGLVALNLATARFRLALESEANRDGLLREAEVGFRCCTAPGDARRGPALHGLGSCLLRRGGTDVEVLEAAAEAFRLCLETPAINESLAADARHDLEMTRLVLVQARAAARNRTEDKTPANDEKPKPPRPDKRPGTPQPVEVGPGNGNPNGPSTPVPTQPGGADPRPTDQHAPGEGKLPPPPDTAESPPLSMRDAAAHVDQAAKLILEERQAHRLRSVKPVPPTVKNW